MNELADRIVALGVGQQDEYENLYWLGNGQPMGDKLFTRSWEVAGALMEKCVRRQFLINIAHDGAVFVYPASGVDPSQSHENILPHAINQACVEALEA